MADSNLDEIRRKRMAEIQGHQGDFRGNAQAMQEQQERAEQEKVFKDTLLTQHLDQAARARLANIRVAKPEKAAMVENLILRMAQSGQISYAQKLNEQSLKSLLEKISERNTKTTVKFDRRRTNLDDSDEDF
ncbi:hypothetical protein ACOMHN_056250 [Nucella lapillus]